MSISSQEYAELSNNSYEERKIGLQADDVEKVEAAGVEYRVLERVSNPATGYQGAIYQQTKTGEIVVAHRGTEPAVKDIAADGYMVLARANPQADDAIALTRRGLEYAKDYLGSPPEVTVTGHSLGGTLAQVSAHHFNLRGETFNAYGAASLDRRIPGGANDRVINHVMATDVVSAASPHYGREHVYATEKEMAVLRQSGYFNNRLLDAVTPDAALVAAGRSFGAHSMHNFLSVDGKGRTDISVLQDPNASRLAEDNRRMIENYRGDVRLLRQVVTMGGRGPVGWVRDGIDHLEGPLPAGAPAAAEAQQPVQQKPADARVGAALPLTRSLGEGAGYTQFSQRDTRHEDVARLLATARCGSPTEMNEAMVQLQQSQFGKAWQQRAEAAAQLQMQDPHVLAPRHAETQHAFAR